MHTLPSFPHPLCAQGVVDRILTHPVFVQSPQHNMITPHPSGARPPFPRFLQGVVDHILTRVVSREALAQHQSAFMLDLCQVGALCQAKSGWSAVGCWEFVGRVCGVFGRAHMPVSRKGVH